MSSKSSRSSGYKSRKSRSITVEQLEDRTLSTVNNLQSALQTLLSDSSGNVSVPVLQSTPTNAAPTVARAINSRGAPVSTVTTREINLSVLGADDKAESLLTYRWRVASAPTGGSGVFNVNNSNAAKNTTLTFNRAGIYSIEVSIVDQEGRSVTASQRITVNQTLSSVIVLSPTGSALANNATVNVSSTNVQLKARGLDQFGQAMSTQPSFAWSSTALPSAGATASISARTDAANITFNRAGTYSFQLQSGNQTARVRVAVAETLTTITATPGTSSVNAGATAQFSAQGLDQFGQVLSRQPTFTWTASTGSISSRGLFTAPSSGTSATVTAAVGAISARISVTVIPNASGLSAAISNLMTSFTADGSVSRLEMIQLLRSVGLDGTVDTTELTDLRNIVSNASRYRIADYVKTLASYVVNTSPANAFYQGTTLGNLTAGSSATVLNKLIDKWFLGTDRPALTSSTITYASAAGPLFVGTPSINNEKQGALGDCYLIATLGSLASSNPDSVRNMFIDNGDGTFTVRFYSGTYSTTQSSDGLVSDGFRGGNGVADYVTVDRFLPAYSNGNFAYSNAGLSVRSTTAPLWIALAEKAYAQWVAGGKSGRNGSNSYASIEGGWMGVVNAQITGKNSTWTSFSSEANRQVLINAIQTGQAVTLGTKASGVGNGLVAGHAYSVSGYNATTGTFTLYNPWGFNHPGPLTWAQLQANCAAFVMANASQTTAFGPVVNNSTQLRAELTMLMAPEVSPSVQSPAVASDAGEDTDLMVVQVDQEDIDSFAAEVADNQRFGGVDGEFSGSSVTLRGPVDFLADLDQLESLLSEFENA